MNIVLLRQMTKLLPILVLFNSPQSLAQKEGGNGGDFLIGSEFYTIGNRLKDIDLVKSYGIEKFLLTNPVTIEPKASEIEVTPGVAADGYSFFRDSTPVTQIYRGAWISMSCRNQYHLVLHELFVNLGVEPSLSYPVSGPIIDQLAARGLNCSGFGEDLSRKRREMIKARLADRNVKLWLASFRCPSNENCANEVGGEFYDAFVRGTPNELRACLSPDNLRNRNDSLTQGLTFVYSDEYVIQKIYQYCYEDAQITTHKMLRTVIEDAVFATIAKIMGITPVQNPLLYGGGRGNSSFLKHFVNKNPDNTFFATLSKELNKKDIIRTPEQLEAQFKRNKWKNKNVINIASDIL